MDEFMHTYFNESYDKLYNKVAAYAVSKCSDLSYVEDIVQETFAEFYKILLKKGVEYIKNQQALLLKIAKVKVYKYYFYKKKHKNTVQLIENENEGECLEIEYGEVEDDLINNYVVKEELGALIKNLPMDVQKVFLLHYNLDKTLKDIAIELKMSESNVKHKLFRSLEKIRRVYKVEE